MYFSIYSPSPHCFNNIDGFRSVPVLIIVLTILSVSSLQINFKSLYIIMPYVKTCHFAITMIIAFKFKGGLYASSICAFPYLRD